MKPLRVLKFICGIWHKGKSLVCSGMLMVKRLHAGNRWELPTPCFGKDATFETYVICGAAAYGKRFYPGGYRDSLKGTGEVFVTMAALTKALCLKDGF